MKGVLNSNGEARRLHFHSVHMLLDSRFGKPWSGGGARQQVRRDWPRSGHAQLCAKALLGCLLASMITPSLLDFLKEYDDEKA